MVLWSVTCFSHLAFAFPKMLNLAGEFKCVGDQFAFLESTVILAMLLQRLGRVALKPFGPVRCLFTVKTMCVVSLKCQGAKKVSCFSEEWIAREWSLCQDSQGEVFFGGKASTSERPAMI